MSEHQDDQQQEKKGQKRKSQIIFVLSSLAALIVVGYIGYFTLVKLQDRKNSDGGLLQEQFEGDPQFSSQLQIECQNSAVKIAKSQDVGFMESEFRQNLENCKDTSISIDFQSFVRPEGNYGDIVVDIAKQLVETDKNKAIDLLKYARDMKTWDFYLGPTSCESQHVLDAYVEAFSVTDEKTCVATTDVQSKVVPQIVSKNFSYLAQIVPQNEVVWLGAPESELGCPEKISAVVEILKKLTTGTMDVDSAPVENTESSQINVNIKLSDKDTVTLVLQGEQQCLKLSSVLVPNPEVTE